MTAYWYYMHLRKHQNVHRLYCSSNPVLLVSGEAITFYTEDDAWQLRSIVNVMRAAGCEVPEWMLQLKKERRKSHTKASKAVGVPKSNRFRAEGNAPASMKEGKLQGQQPVMQSTAAKSRIARSKVQS